MKNTEKTADTQTTFRLRGTQYTLGRKEVEEKLRGCEPKPVEKYQVIINGRRYPPKQVLEVALGIPVLSFTTMDANRILSKLGFEIQRSDELPVWRLVESTLDSGTAEDIHPLLLNRLAASHDVSLYSGKPHGATASQFLSAWRGRGQEARATQLLRAYLHENLSSNFVLEAETGDQDRRFDFEIIGHDSRVVLELKTLDSDEDQDRASPALHRLREYTCALQTVEECQRSSCCLVLYNPGISSPSMKWQFVYWAMLGNVALKEPIDQDPDEVLTRARAKVAHLSAIMILERLRIGYLRFEAHVRTVEARQGKTLSLPEYLQLAERARGTDQDISLTQPRIVAHENPYAGRPLSRELFCGPYDVRYGADHNGQISRIHTGKQLQKLEHGLPQ